MSDAGRGTQLLVALAALTSALGCARPPSAPAGRLVENLVEAFPHATVRSPTTMIDIGTPQSRPLLVRGWTHEIADLPGGVRKGGWTMGDGAELEFFVAAIAEDLPLTFFVAPVEPDGAMSLAVNGVEIWDGPLTPAYLPYPTTIPAAALQLGENRLTIRHNALSRPHQPLKDARVVWDYVRFGPEGRSPTSPASVSGDRLLVPFGTRVDYYVSLPADSRLTIRQLASRPRSSGVLRVSWTALDGSPPVDLVEWASGSSLAQVITEQSAERGRLSLFALSPEQAANEPGSGMVLSAPEVRAGSSVSAALPVENPQSEEPSQHPSAVGLDQPDVIVYMIDTLRADHLHCYGYSRETSPSIDRFAAEAILFENAQAQAPWTRASVASLLTGLWPQQHRAEDDLDALPEEAVTVAEHLHKAGYYTAAVVANGNVNQYAGFGQGFDQFVYLQNVRPGQLLARATDVNEAIASVLSQRPPERPLFLWVLAIDPHLPYQAPEPFHSRFSGMPRDVSRGTSERIGVLKTSVEPVPDSVVEELVDLYDAEVAANDAAFGSFLEELERHGIDRESLVVLTADHGEEFYDHGGWDHGSTLHSEVLNIPLIVRVPGGSPAMRRTEIVDHVDITATILDAAGIAAGIAPGRSLLPLLRPAHAVEWDSWALSRQNLRGRVAMSLVNEDWKLIVGHYEGVAAYPELYSRRDDPREANNLAGERPDLARFLVTRLAIALATVGSEKLDTSQLDPEVLERNRRQLEALGYL